MRLLAVLLPLPWLLLALVPGMPGMAHAQQSRNEAAELVVRSDAAGCDDRLKLERRVNAILGRNAFAPGRGLVVAVRFGREGDELFAEVTASGPKPGHRELRDVGPSCEALSAGVAVAIALLLDSAELAPPEPSKSETPATVAPPSRAPSTEPSETPPTHSTPPRSRSWHVRASLAGAGSYGLGGDVTGLGLARVGVRNGHWLLDVGVGASLPTQDTFDGGSVQTSLWFGSARGCYLVGQGASLGPCAQVGVGQLRGEGSGYGETRAARLPWVAASLGLGAELPVGARFATTFEASLWLPLERHTFSVENRGTAWESKPVAGVLGLGVSLSFF